MNNKPMKLRSLEIKEDWSDRSKLTGSVSFRGSNSSVTLDINAELVQKIIDLCADALVEAAKDAADVMRSDIIESMSNPELSLPKSKKGFFK